MAFSQVTCTFWPLRTSIVGPGKDPLYVQTGVDGSWECSFTSARRMEIFKDARGLPVAMLMTGGMRSGSRNFVRPNSLAGAGGAACPAASCTWAGVDSLPPGSFITFMVISSVEWRSGFQKNCWSHAPRWGSGAPGREDQAPSQGP